MRLSNRTPWTRIFLLLFSCVLGAGSALAHPMGNFSINHYGRIQVGEKSVEILYLVDMAEIPTFQEMRQFGIVPKTDDLSALRYLDGQETQLRQGLSLECDGQRIELTTVSRRVEFAEGAGGLPTMKLALVLRGKLDGVAGTHRLAYSDNNFPGRAGWKEIVVGGNGAGIIESSAPQTDRSKELTNYSSDSLNSPPQLLSAQIEFRTSALATETRASATITQGIVHAVAPAFKSSAKLHPPAVRNPARAVSAAPLIPQSASGLASPGGVAASASGTAVPATPRAQTMPRSRFTDLISTRGNLSFWFLLSAALIAAGLGALHALEPGHGKTIVAAYLVGSRGTARHAVLLGIVVTVAHTAGVYLLGIITLYASRYIVPELLYPWLGAISGLSVAGLGIFTFLKHWTGENGEHSHARGSAHSHWFLSMFQARVAEVHSAQPKLNEAGGVSLRELCLLGITGGIVPCPAALVVLLSAFSLHRIGFGLFLITAFSLGLAAVLVSVGLTMVYTKRLMASRMQMGGSLVRYLPLLSSAFMILLGVGIAASAFGSLPIGASLVTKDKLIPFITVILLGLFLGMRHSTDPDHVVAVSTIVSRQKSLKGSASIGLLWGLGHTLTIFLVGSAIIIFGVVIPPRLGLSMEFCVALMLILLGLLNLTGVTGRIAERSSPSGDNAAVAVRSDQRVPGSAGAGGFQSVRRRIEPLLPGTVGNLGLYQTLRPLVIGLVHGLAGSAAVALLVLSTIKSPFWATAYLLVFGFGTMLGMMFMTTAMSLPLIYAGNRFFRVNAHLATISGLASMAFGMFLVYHIGLVDGLFSARPHWIPQ